MQELHVCVNRYAPTLSPVNHVGGLHVSVLNPDEYVSIKYHGIGVLLVRP